jgi:hypothetical protein
VAASPERAFLPAGEWEWPFDSAVVDLFFAALVVSLPKRLRNGCFALQF